MRLGKRERLAKRERLKRIAAVTGFSIRTSLQDAKIMGKKSPQWDWKPKPGPKPNVTIWSE
jgi:hypothetical protein